jgi:Flp pilus assembly protein TadG
MTPASRSRRTSTRSAEAGTGAVGTLVGVTVFLSLLLVAVQTSLNLYAASTVTAAAFDGARIVAGADAGADAPALAAAEEHVRSLLGDQVVGFAWTVDDEVVALTVTAVRPTRLLRDLPLPFDTVERTVRVRREAFR